MSIFWPYEDSNDVIFNINRYLVPDDGEQWQVTMAKGCQRQLTMVSSH